MLSKMAMRTNSKKENSNTEGRFSRVCLWEIRSSKLSAWKRIQNQREKTKKEGLWQRSLEERPFEGCLAVLAMARIPWRGTALWGTDFSLLVHGEKGRGTKARVRRWAPLESISQSRNFSWLLMKGLGDECVQRIPLRWRNYDQMREKWPSFRLPRTLGLRPRLPKALALSSLPPVRFRPRPLGVSPSLSRLPFKLNL